MGDNVGWGGRGEEGLHVKRKHALPVAPRLLFCFFQRGRQEITLVSLYSECNWISAWKSALSLMLKVQTANFLLFQRVVKCLEFIYLNSGRAELIFCFKIRRVQGHMEDMLRLSAEYLFYSSVCLIAFNKKCISSVSQVIL